MKVSHPWRAFGSTFIVIRWKGFGVRSEKHYTNDLFIITVLKIFTFCTPTVLRKVRFLSIVCYMYVNNAKQ